MLYPKIQEEKLSRELFQNPTSEYRSAPFWSWNCDLPAEDILQQICGKGFKKIILAPFMVVSGDHARNDLAGDREDSWKSVFLKKGFEVETVLCGIGEWEEVQELFAAHAGLCLN